MPPKLSLNRPSAESKSTGPRANDYLNLTPEEHVYRISDTYIGSDEQMERDEYLLDMKTMHISNNTITVPQGVERVILEIISNASDNVGRSRRLGLDAKNIEVKMTRSTISVKNYGSPIPVEINSQTGLYAPEMILGNLRTSSNYEGERLGAGRNGYGAKLCNIFSKVFLVIVHDGIRGKSYVQKWGHNMSMREPPIIKDYAGESSVEVRFTLDFARFKYRVPKILTQGDPLLMTIYPSEQGGYPDEAFALIARHCADISFTCKIPVIFSDLREREAITTMNYINIKDYARLYLGESVDKSCLLHNEYPPDTVMKAGRNGRMVPENKAVQPCFELCVVDSPDEGMAVSFVNSMVTRNGGTHVEAAVKAFGAGVADEINKHKKADKKNKKFSITERDVAKHVSFFVNCYAANPKFDAQTKTKLCSPKIKITLHEADIKSVTRWSLVTRLYAELHAKQFKMLQKTDGKKREMIDAGKAEDANYAGKRKYSHNCILYAVEGQSAMGYPRTLISLTPNGKDFFGIFPFKGKVLNVNKADQVTIAENVELSAFKDILGLTEGTDYMHDGNFGTLRYGELRILVDADDDGQHILGLILNYFRCRFPSLLQRPGFIKRCRTPCLRVEKGRQQFTFYLNSQYEEWKTRYPDWAKWGYTYYKGLGTSTDADVREDKDDPKTVTYDFVPERDIPAFDLAFHQDLADARKRWISSYQPVLESKLILHQPISDFINHEFILHSLANVERSLPSGFDGLKMAQRKLIYASMQKWTSAKSAKDKNTKMKVAALATYALDETKYHHGNVCLEGVIAKMARDYPGTNNLPYFTQDGQFGTRFGDGGDCAKARYINTRIEWWLHLVFRKEDKCLLKYRIDEGKECEPYALLPIVPLLVINGSSGMGTGWSTYTPPHNPMDVLNWLYARLAGVEVPNLVPWFRDFTGLVELRGQPIIDRLETKSKGPSLLIKPLPPKPRLAINGNSDHKLENVKNESAKEDVKVEVKAESKSEQSDDDEDLPVGDKKDDDSDDEGKRTRGKSRYYMVTKGRYHIDNNQVVITELPIGTNGKAYREWLETLWKEKKIDRPRDCCTNTTVRFEISGFQNPNIRSLRLRRVEGLCNMNTLNLEGRVKKYNSVAQIMEDFYTTRLTFYEARKINMMQEIKDKIGRLSDKLQFIILVNNKTIIITGTSKSNLHKSLDENKLPYRVLDDTRAGEFTDEGRDKVGEEIREQKQKLQNIADITVRAMWIADLQEFESKYRKHYNMPEQKKPILQMGLPASKPKLKMGTTL